jgi:glyoxylate carboligase
MSVRRHGLAELVEHDLHGAGAHRRQDQGDAGIALGTDGAEQVDRLVAQAAQAARSLSMPFSL